MERFKESQIWYVAFLPRRLKFNWWHIFSHKHFGHVSLYRAAGNGVLNVDCLQHIAAARHFEMDIESAVEQLLPGATAVMQVTVHYEAHYRSMAVEPLTCVTFAKRFLCIRNAWVQSPRALYRELLKAGAVVVKAPYWGEV